MGYYCIFYNFQSSFRRDHWSRLRGTQALASKINITRSIYMHPWHEVNTKYKRRTNHKRDKRGRESRLKEKKRGRKRAINERYAPVPWKVLIRERDARTRRRTNEYFLRIRLCVHVHIRVCTPTHACKCVYQPHVSRNSQKEDLCKCIWNVKCPRRNSIVHSIISLKKRFKIFFLYRQSF